MVKKILMVDDESRVLYTVKHGLEALDDSIQVKTVENGESCLDELKKDLPDIILLDVNMPEMSGWIVFDTIRDNESWKDIPIIFLTARTDEISRKAGSFMAEDYMEKPVDIVELKKRIDMILKVE